MAFISLKRSSKPGGERNKQRTIRSLSVVKSTKHKEQIMRIGVNALFLIPSRVGGTEVYLRQTLMAIASEYPDIPMAIFTNRENHNLLKMEFTPFRQVEFELMDFSASNRYNRIFREQFELPYRARKKDIDVLWSPGYTMPLFMHCPQVVTIHDMQYKNFPGDFSFIARQTMNILVDLACRKSRAIIAVSSFSKDEIIKYTHSHAKKVKVISEAADPEFLKPLTPHLRKKILKNLVPYEIPYILSVANTYPHKNMHTLVEAFALLSDNLPHNLVVVGNPHRAEEKLTKSVSRLKNKKRFIRLRNLSKQQLASLYQHADIFVFPSLYEGFGLPVLEAMVSGVPVVTTKMASIPEVGGKYVLYVDKPTAEYFAEKIREGIGWNNAYRSAFVSASKTWAKGFSWKKTAAETVEVLMQTTKTGT